MGICETGDVSVDLEHQPLMEHTGGLDTCRHLFDRRYFGFEGDYGVQHVGAVDFGARRSVGRSRGADV